MNKKFQKSVAIGLTIIMVATTTTPVFAETDYIKYDVQDQISNDSNLTIWDDGVVINGVYYTRVEFTDKLYQAVKVEVNDVQTYAIAAGVYFIPGIGQIAIAATGAIVVAGVTVAAGTWLYETITEWLSDSEAREIAEVRAQIPSRFRTDDGDVDLDKFTEKVNGKKAYKEEKGWTIEQDTAGHGGRAWKLKDKSGKRVASLSEDGKVLGK